MDARHEKDSPQLDPPQTVAVGPSETSTPSDSPMATPLLIPQLVPGSPIMTNFPYSTSYLQQPRRHDSPFSSTRQSSEGLVFTAKPRSSVTGSPLNPARARDSAFAPPPLRAVSVYADNNSIIKAPEKAVIMKSTMLERDADGKVDIDKPWVEKKDPYIRISYILTYAFMFLGP